MGTSFEVRQSFVQTGIGLGAMNHQPLYSDLSSLVENGGFTNQDYNSSSPPLPPPPPSGSVQFAPPTYTPPLSCNRTSSLYPTSPKPTLLYYPSDFKRTETKFTQLPPVPEEYKEKNPVLSPNILGEIDRLRNENYYDYHPWKNDESQHVHTIITKISDEITQQFPQLATKEGFMQCLAFCEKAIYEIEQLHQITLGNKEMLELGIRNALSKCIEVFQGNCLGEEFERTKVIPAHIEDIPSCLTQFETRGGYYLPSVVRDRSELFHELLTVINHHFIRGLSEDFDQQNLDQLLLSEQFERCQALINEKLMPYKTTPNAGLQLQRRAHQSMTYFFSNHHVPLFKKAYEKGLPLPFDLSQMLDGLYHLASNNSSFMPYDKQDPRQAFLLNVFGTDDCLELKEEITKRAQSEKAAIKQAPTPTGKPAQSKTFWSRIFSKGPTSEQLAVARKNAALSEVDRKETGQRLAVGQLERYFGIIQQPTTIIEPSAPPIDLFEELPIEPSAPPIDLFEELPVEPDPDPAFVLDTKPVIPTVASQKVSVTFPAQLKKQAPTGSYIHISFHDLLEKTAADEDLFGQFPKLVQRDLMRHLFYRGVLGPAEARIQSVFKKNVDEKRVAHINILYNSELRQLDNQLKTTRRTKEQQQGEEILSLYYEGKENDSVFLNKLSALPTNELFLYYVWEIAKNANVEIPDTDHDWARGHYKDPQFVHLTMQALERLLHTS